MTGLQTSQPRPVPRRAMISSNDVSSSTRIDSNSSWRESAKCSQSAREGVTPDFVSSASRSFLTSGTHDPHWVPARVQAFSAPSSVQPSACSSPFTASRIVPALTLLQAQTRAAAGSSSPAGASMPDAER